MIDASACGDQAAGPAIRLGTHRAPALRQIVVGRDEEAHGMLGEVQSRLTPLPTPQPSTGQRRALRRVRRTSRAVG